MTLLKYKNEIKGDMAKINADVTSTRTCKTVMNWAPGSHFHKTEIKKTETNTICSSYRIKGLTT